MSTHPPKPRTTTGDHLRPVDEPPARESQPVTRDDVDDPALLPRLLRLVATELRDLNAVVRGQVMPAIKRLEDQRADDVRHVDEHFASVHRRIDELQAQLDGAR